MKHFRFTLALVLALCLAALSAPAASAESAVYSHLGETLPDFSVATIDGGTFTLSEALAEKDMVLINLWATWCGPCRMEFPYMQQAYELYEDRVAVIALSVEPTDTDEVLAAFAEENGLTFQIGSDAGVGLGATFATVGIPTTLAVDRFGVITFIEIGSQPSTDSFTRLFDAFVGDGYTESRVLGELPASMPDVDPVDEALLNAALNVEGGGLAFRNPEDPSIWPMVPAGDAVRSALVSTNGGKPESASSVMTRVTAAEGDVLAFEFFTSSEPAADLLTVSVDGAVVKSFGGEHDWTEWGVALEAGDHEIAFSYVKDVYAEVGDDIAMIDNVRVVSGDEAAAILAALPVAPTAGETALAILDGEAREIVFDDPDGLLAAYFACQSYWIVPSGAVEVRVDAAADIDPETAFIYSNFDGSQALLPETVNEDGTGYGVSTGIDSMDTTGYAYTNLYLYPSGTVESMDDLFGVMLFVDEANVNSLVQEIAGLEGVELSWRYADGTEPLTIAAAGGDSPLSEYAVYFVDQDGAPVPGCIVNFCTDETCVPVIADENGAAVFSGAPYAYHLQVIKVPEGYEFDTAQAFYAEEDGGEMTFVVTRK